MFSNPKDDPWANKADDDDEWDTDPDFENKDTIKEGKKEEIVSAAEAQRRLRDQLEEERAKKFGLPQTVNVPKSNFEAPEARAQPTKSWNPSQDLAGRGNVSSAKNTFSQPAYQEPAPAARSSAPARPAAPKPAPVQSAPPPKPAPVQSAPPAPKPVQAAPPPAPKPVQAAPPPAPKAVAAPPAPKPAPPPPAPVAPPPPVEESYDQGYDQGGYDQNYDGYDQGGYDQGGYDQGGAYEQSYDQGGGYEQSYDQGGYDQGGYDQSYDQSYDQGGYDQGGYLGQCRAIYQYTGENETDLVFNEGDIINIVNDSDPSGWWEGELNGAQGYFPSNFVERI